MATPAPVRTVAPSSANDVETEAQNPNRQLGDLSRLPAGTQVYAIDTYNITTGAFGRDIPANVELRWTPLGLIVTFENGKTQSFPAASTVAFRPKSMYIYVYPGHDRPPITFARIAHRIR
jgi:hypothetical protein